MNVVDVSERLMAEFEGRLGLEVVSRTVMACRDDLAGSIEQALPELVERCARQRLLAILSKQSEQNQTIDLTEPTSKPALYGQG